MSRHLYDFYQLLNSSVKDRALSDISLLDRVADHKKVYFASVWANYDRARNGTIKLTPQSRVLSELKKDYELMSAMFYGNPRPEWDVILKAIGEFEKEFNKTLSPQAKWPWAGSKSLFYRFPYFILLFAELVRCGLLKVSIWLTVFANHRPPFLVATFCDVKVSAILWRLVPRLRSRCISTTHSHSFSFLCNCPWVTAQANGAWEEWLTILSFATE